MKLAAVPEAWLAMPAWRAETPRKPLSRVAKREVRVRIKREVLGMLTNLFVWTKRVSNGLEAIDCRWILVVFISMGLLSSCDTRTAYGKRQDKIDAFELELIQGPPPDRLRDTDCCKVDAVTEAEYREGLNDGNIVGSHDGLMAGKQGADCDTIDAPEPMEPDLGYDAGKSNGFWEGYVEACEEGYEEFILEDGLLEADQ